MACLKGPLVALGDCHLNVLTASIIDYVRQPWLHSACLLISIVCCMAAQPWIAENTSDKPLSHLIDPPARELKGSNRPSIIDGVIRFFYIAVEKQGFVSWVIPAFYWFDVYYYSMHTCTSWSECTRWCTGRGPKGVPLNHINIIYITTETCSRHHGWDWCHTPFHSILQLQPFWWIFQKQVNFNGNVLLSNEI
jgi:hypothetical protein